MTITEKQAELILSAFISDIDDNCHMENENLEFFKEILDNFPILKLHSRCYGDLYKNLLEVKQ